MAKPGQQPVGSDSAAMQGSGRKSFARHWDDYQPSKSTLIWACAVTAIATMIVGFTWGGWVSGKTSREIAAAAATMSRGDLAGEICVERFNAAPDAVTRLAELKGKTGTSARRQFVEAGGWATMPDQTRPDSRGAEACAAALAA